MSATVEITEDGGEYTAVDSETGAVGQGDSRATALAALAVRLGSDERSVDSKTQLATVAERTQRRFDAEDVTPEDVADAIAWARSE
jgi:hypothetical protein